MNKLHKRFAGAILAITAASFLAWPRGANSQAPQTQPADETVPAFHPAAPKDALPPTMDPSVFTDFEMFNAYTVAGQVKKVLYQQPCYCHCDRSQGHQSLLDCFASRHGSGCNICMGEAFYSYEQTHKGKTPAQIREGIIHGEWQKVDLAKYQKSYLPPRNATGK
jgi:hypothetical protein